MGQDGESDFSAHVLQGLCESSQSVGHVFVAQKCKMKWDLALPLAATVKTDE